MNSIISIFISESQNNLEQASEALLRLEETPNDLDILNTIFRSVHTIKGSSGLLPVKPLTRVAHCSGRYPGCCQRRKILYLSGYSRLVVGKYGSGQCMD